MQIKAKGEPTQAAAPILIPSPTPTTERKALLEGL